MDRAMRAYDIEILQRMARQPGLGEQGWTFGLPPGILPQHWPLDTSNGYPLMHGFTIRLPEDYRVHGPHITGLSFFAVAPDHNDGGAVTSPDIRKVLADVNGGAPTDPYPRSFWQAERLRHPRLHRMTDMLGCSYALILLTQEEFDGPYCEPPPPLQGNPDESIRPPAWLTKGSAASYWEQTYSPSLGLAVEKYAVYRMFGELPERGLWFNRALSWLPRPHDPNAGRTPREEGYEPDYYWVDDNIKPENYRLHDWAKDYKVNHIGGTMRPMQGIPMGFSPFYIEFGEEMGGYNFGGGIAQLDIFGMKFNWDQ